MAESTSTIVERRRGIRNQRDAEQAREDARAGVALVAIYLIDAGLLAGFAALGLVSWLVPPLYAMVGIVIAGGFALAAVRAGKARLDECKAVLGQTVVALLLTSGVAWFNPRVAMLMLLTIVVIIPTAALRLSSWRLLLLTLLAAFACAALVHRHRGQLLVPAGSLWEQALTALFFLWTIIKGTSVNLAGMAMRLALDDSHAKVAGALARVEELAETDELTGLANRRRILEILAKVREQQVQGGHSYSIAMLDVDHFKRINDTFGHAVGDEVLRAVGDLMRGATRSSDAAGRIGGEEFLLVLPGAGNLGDAQLVAEQLRATVEGYDWSSLQPELHVTASIGFAVAEAGETAEQVLRRADQGLYLAKRSGRNRVSHRTSG
jgi:diguanylate cyclase (GGDEF)-like protein